MPVKKHPFTDPHFARIGEVTDDIDVQIVVPKESAYLSPADATLVMQYMNALEAVLLNLGMKFPRQAPNLKGLIWESGARVIIKNKYANMLLNYIAELEVKLPDGLEFEEDAKEAKDGKEV